MEGTEDDVPCQGGPHGDARRLAIADFADDEDIRVLAQNGAQAVGKGHIHLLVDLHLIDPRNIIFHRVLQRYNIAGRSITLLQRGI